MFIERVYINNFKCIKNLDIVLPKITILAGANSSGKSSIINAILGAIQSKAYPFYYSPNGDYVDMGDFREIITDHKSDEVFDVNISLNDNGNSITYTARYTDEIMSRMPKLVTGSYESSTLKLDIQSNNNFVINYKHKPENDPTVNLFGSVEWNTAIDKFFKDTSETILKIVGPKKGKQKDQPSNKVKDPSSMFSLGNLEGIVEVSSPNDINDKNVDNYFARNEIIRASKVLGQFNGNFNYISSFRLAPQRTNYLKPHSRLKITKFGDNCLDQIVDWEQNNKELHKKLTTILSELQLAERVRVLRMRGGRYDIRIKTHKDAPMASLSDVGFGVSQLLPIIVADLQLQKGSTLIVSQPEIHLHPSSQANLAEHFVNNANADNKRYILETHSEYMINRIRYLITSGAIKEKDVNLIFLDKTCNSCTPYIIKLQKNGQIKGAPDNFFKTYMMDVMNIAMEANSAT